MKTKINSLLVIAAGFALSAAGAYGQDRVVAHIPFAFYAGGQVQAAGEYSIAQQGVVTVLQNADTGRKISAGMGVAEDNNANKPPSLIFTCGDESGCTLTQARLADGRAWKYSAPRPKASEEARVIVIYLESAEAE
ncbi:MAG TPA: hypothetical protein VIY49_03355 [Bryobacteraceae bacterium]